MQLKGIEPRGWGITQPFPCPEEYFRKKSSRYNRLFFIACRDKRNLADYGVSEIIPEKEAQELKDQAKMFFVFVQKWLKGHFKKEKY